jgi:hypothetical protein
VYLPDLPITIGKGAKATSVIIRAVVLKVPEDLPSSRTEVLSGAFRGNNLSAAVQVFGSTDKFSCTKDTGIEDSLQAIKDTWTGNAAPLDPKKAPKGAPVGPSRAELAKQCRDSHLAPSYQATLEEASSRALVINRGDASVPVELRTSLDDVEVKENAVKRQTEIKKNMEIIASISSKRAQEKLARIARLEAGWEALTSLRTEWFSSISELTSQQKQIAIEHRKELEERQKEANLTAVTPTNS